jgi:LacI family transcriptional regulator
MAERLAGYRAGLEAVGQTFFGALLVRCGRQLSALAMLAAWQLLGLAKPPTAIVSGNNEMTREMPRGICEATFACPQRGHGVARRRLVGNRLAKTRK